MELGDLMSWLVHTLRREWGRNGLVTRGIHSHPDASTVSFTLDNHHWEATLKDLGEMLPDEINRSDRLR
jgi:hypothetical protein